MVIDLVYAHPINLIRSTVTSATTKPVFLVLPSNDCDVCKGCLSFLLYVIEFFLNIPPHTPMQSTVFQGNVFFV